jgi:hypothetical protein
MIYIYTMNLTLASFVIYLLFLIIQKIIYGTITKKTLLANYWIFKSDAQLIDALT